MRPWRSLSPDDTEKVLDGEVVCLQVQQELVSVPWGHLGGDWVLSLSRLDIWGEYITHSFYIPDQYIGI